MQLKAILALVLAAILALTNVVSYYTGKDACRQEQIENAQNETRDSVESNVGRADTTASGFRDREAQHEQAQDKLNSSIDRNPTADTCNLSADELRAFQELLSITGSSVPSEGAGTVQAVEPGDEY